MPVQLFCVVCQQPFWVKPSRATSRKSCSRACQHRMTGPPVLARCCICDQPFERPHSYGLRFRAAYCSFACYRRDRQSPERFWAYANREPGVLLPHMTTPCWVWQGGRYPDGYGSYRKRGAHRMAYELTYGAIPRGVEVLHRCDNPPCINPEHLFLGTHAENMHDAINKGRMNAQHPHLTADQVVAIRRRAATQPFTYSALAQEYGVSKYAIFDVIKRRSWKHLP